MSAGPQLSPDGKWWWNGSQWVPVLGTALGQPATQSIQTAPQQVPGANPSAVYVYGPRSNGLAVASLVLGIMSWLLCPFIGGLLAVILGHTARGQIRRTRESRGGMAMAGLVLGYIHLVAVALITIFWIAVFGGLTALLGVIGSLPAPRRHRDTIGRDPLRSSHENS